MTPTAAILTYRHHGVTQALRFADAKAALDQAPLLAELHGECDIHYVRESVRFLHSKAVPHDQIPLAPEVLV